MSVTITGAASGAASGAATGASFGPWGAAIGGVLGALGGMLGSRGGKAKYPSEYLSILKSIAQYTKVLRRGHFAPPPFSLELGPTAWQRELWSQARQFGATGLQPFISSLTALASQDYTSQVTGMLSKLAEMKEQTYASAVRQRAGLAGAMLGTDVLRATADVIGKARLEAGVRAAEYGLQAGKVRLGASQLGLTAIPGAFQALSGIAGQEYAINEANLKRRMQDWYLRYINAPIALVGAAKGAATPLQTPATMTPLGATLLAAGQGLSTYANYNLIQQLLK